MGKLSLSLATLLLCMIAVQAIEICPGDTRGDRKCNHDMTHRVCAKIGVRVTSFWKFTGQRSWCGTKGSYDLKYSPHGHDVRCPRSTPSWCICKWATAKWIKGEGCNASIQFNCAATDVCNLKLSYKDFNVDLKPAHDCMKTKCKAEWDACPDLPPSNDEEKEEGARFHDLGSFNES